MNASKVRSEIEKVITESRSHMHPKQRNKQYAPGKAQLAKLTELGILDLMPAGFGFSDADAVIRAASAEKSAIMNAYGEGEEVPASALNQVIAAEEEFDIYGDPNSYFVRYDIPTQHPKARRARMLGIKYSEKSFRTIAEADAFEAEVRKHYDDDPELNITRRIVTFS